MSDERLGTNPLDWVTPAAGAVPGTAKSAAPAAPPEASGPAPETTQPAPQADTAGPRTALFRPAATDNEETTMGKGKIKIEQTMDTAQVVAYLKDLADSIESGVIRAENEDTALVLGVPETMQVELKLARKKDKAKCEIELEWLDDGSQAESLKISGE